MASYIVDAQVMAMSGTARERTSNEFASLLSESGFGLRRVVPTSRLSASSKRSPTRMSGLASTPKFAHENVLSHA
jgi:hypothetical protein